MSNKTDFGEAKTEALPSPQKLLELLAKESGRYRLTPETEAYLVKDKDSYLGGLFELSPGFVEAVDIRADSPAAVASK